MKFKKIHRHGLALACALVLGSDTAFAENTYHIDIPSRDISQALKEFAKQSGLQVVYYSQIAEGQASSAVSGELTAKQALTQLLENTDLTFSTVDENTVAIQPSGNVGVSGEDKAGPRSKQRKQEDGVFEEMIVTAQRRAQNVSDVPISISVFGSEDLEKLKIGDLEDLAFSAPGLSVTSNGDNQRRIFLRGAANLAGSSSLVGIYLDEIPVTAGAAKQLDLRTYDLDRVEVLRGPQGTLYGAGSSGGTIRFITKDPQLNDLHGRTNVALSFTNDGTASHKVEGMLDIPVVEDELGFRISGVVDDEGGWINHPAVDDINDRSLVDVRLRGLWVPSEALKVNIMALVHRNEGSPNQGEDENGNYIPPFNELLIPAISDDYDIYNLTLTYDLGSASFQTISSYFTSETHSRNLGSVTADTDHTLFSSLIEQSGFTQETRLSSNGDGPWQWTIGGFYRNFDESVFYPEFRFGPLASPATISDFGNEGSSKSWAVFGDTSYAINDRFELGVGLRYFEDDRTTASFPFLFNGVQVGVLETQEGTFDAVSPRVYANFDINEDVMIYSSVAEGFRSGGFNTLGQPSYEPEELLNYEVGTKMSLWEGRLAVDLSVYYSDYSNYIVRGDTTGTGVGIDSNAGDVVIKGIEWTTTWHTTDNFSLMFRGNYVDSVLDEINAVNSSFEVGDRVSFTPEYLFNLSANYDFIWKTMPGFARLDYGQQGRSVFINRPFNQFGMSDVINMLNFNMGWQLKEGLSFGLFARNLLDDRGFIDATISQAARSRPRTVGIEIGVEF